MDKILILDFGAQYAQLIARRVRELKVFCEIHPHDISEEAMREFAPRGIILSGGPASVADSDSPKINPAVFSQGAPILGVCYGMQAMAKHFGGEVAPQKNREYGAAIVRRKESSPLIDSAFNSAEEMHVWMSHGDRVQKPPMGFSVIAEGGGGGDESFAAAIADEQRKLYGLQFHPEVAHTSRGREILSQFVRVICNCKGEWTMPNFIESAVADIRRKAGGGGVLLALSGGVDSAVAAALLHRALGDKLICVFVDHGLLRLNEAEQVREVFENHFGIKLICIDASRRFFAALKGVTDPEKKRRIIGENFIAVFEEEAKKIKDVDWLAQGTIYPDVIESAGGKTGKASAIKSHHNVGGLPSRLNLKLLEPLRELFKDEVRALGIELGLPKEMVFRHPFPGPGLAVRILGEVTPPLADSLRRADAIFLEELRAMNYYEKTAQAFAVLLPVKSVGVMGDSRTYENVAALRAVNTDDFMTADWSRLPNELLARVSSRIINEVTGINRVVYDISSKPPATVEWE